MKKLEQEEVISRIKKHFPTYTFTTFNYVNKRTKVEVGCNVHGKFTALAANLMSGHGCVECAKISIGNKNSSSIKQFVEKATKIHNNGYNYDKVIYYGSKTKVEITCNMHGNFFMTPNAHLSGQGCPLCGLLKRGNNPSGWSTKQWETCANNSNNFKAFTLYIIECWDEKEHFYKIGKTFRDLLLRFKDFPYTWKILHTEIGSADYISAVEKTLHKQLKQFSYTPTQQFFGKTECFSSKFSLKDLKSAIAQTSTSK